MLETDPAFATFGKKMVSAHKRWAIRRGVIYHARIGCKRFGRDCDEGAIYRAPTMQFGPELLRGNRKCEDMTASRLQNVRLLSDNNQEPKLALGG